MLLMSILFIMNIQKINKHAYGYPAKLYNIPSPPKQLYALGDTSILNKTQLPWVGIVGTRNPSRYGIEVTRQFATQLARDGLTIVSGLALGIDAVAHQAAVDLQRPTVAVLPGGLNKIYPADNHGLAKQIIDNGGVLVSEYHPDTPSFKQNFIARNRLVSGLSDGVVVTEAALDSGTKHTVRFAQEQNKQIMAVPGNITSFRSAGTNNLLRSGAAAVTSPSDILNVLGYGRQLHAQPVTADSHEESILIELLNQGITSSEELIANGQLSASQFANIIGLMEISGKVMSLGGGHWTIRR